MKCTTVKTPDGAVFVVCERGRKRAEPCRSPGCGQAAVALCDFPVRGTKSGTCDRPMCRQCRSAQGQNVDYCPPHARAMRPGLFDPRAQTQTTKEA